MAFDKNKLNPKNVNVIITTAVNNVFPPPTIQYLTNSGVLLYILRLTIQPQILAHDTLLSIFLSYARQ